MISSSALEAREQWTIARPPSTTIVSPRRTQMTATSIMIRCTRERPSISGNCRRTSFRGQPSNAFTQAPPQQRQGLLGGLLGALQGRGVNTNSLQSQLGLGSADPQRMGPNDYARIADYARTQHPDVMRRQVSEQPWMVKAMGNPIVMGALGVVASRMLKKRMR